MSMRITNTMMMDSTLRNVGKSKSNLDAAENQMGSEKKIQRPSDDPIIAIRALNLRSTVNEIDMYLSKNVPSSESWLNITTAALDNMNGTFQDIYAYCTQGASDEFTESDRSAIIDVLRQYKDALYSEANADNAGRYVFTGFKTDTSFSFLSQGEADSKSYTITEKFSGKDITKNSVMLRPVNVNTVASIPATGTPETKEYYRMRFAYNSLGSAQTTSVTANSVNYSVVTLTQNQLSQTISNGTFDSATGTIYYISDTGELAIPDAAYADFKDESNISFSYDKTGFIKNDPRPEMYFDCVDKTDPGNVINYTFDPDSQIIEYTVNFNQQLQVNTLGCKTISPDMARDIDEMCDALQKVKDAESNIAKLKEMKESSAYASNIADIDSMLAAAQKQCDYAIDHMEKIFSEEMKKVKAYQENINTQVADIGARSKRLTLTKGRLTEQLATFKDLKSKNEDVELEETVIKYSASKTLYDAALTSASNAVKQSLLDYI